MEELNKLMDLLSDLDEKTSSIKIDAEELSDMEELDSKRAYRDGQDFIKKCVDMNRKLTDLIEGEDSAYDICELQKEVSNG